MHNIQTVLVPAGGAAVVEFQPKVPGIYSFVDHSIFRAFNKGAIGLLNVTGNADPLVYSGKQSDTIFTGGTMTNADITQTTVPILATPGHMAVATSPTPAGVKLELGNAVYMQTCFVCHQSNGLGVPGQIPPLAGSDFLLRNNPEVIQTVLRGRTGEVTVNGNKYNGTMIPLGNLTDEQIANVLTYVRNSWGNRGAPVTPVEVHHERSNRSTLAVRSNSFE